MAEYTRRDYLAQDRTSMANERTLLAYWRTSLAFLILGTFIYKFFSEALIISALSLAIGFVIFIFGLYRFFVLRNRIRKR